LLYELYYVNAVKVLMCVHVGNEAWDDGVGAFSTESGCVCSHCSASCSSQAKTETACISKRMSGLWIHWT